MTDITPSPADENPSKSTAIHTGSENRLNDEHSPPIQEVLQWPSTSERKLKKTQRIPFVITRRTTNALLQEKENKKKEEKLAKLERKREREKKKEENKDTAGKSSIEKTNDKRGTHLKLH
jgi:hypothetical protein